jgi:hypothetical protein
VNVVRWFKQKQRNVTACFQSYSGCICSLFNYAVDNTNFTASNDLVVVNNEPEMTWRKLSWSSPHFCREVPRNTKNYESGYSLTGQRSLRFHDVRVITFRCFGGLTSSCTQISDRPSFFILNLLTSIIRTYRCCGLRGAHSAYALMQFPKIPCTYRLSNSMLLLLSSFCAI